MIPMGPTLYEEMRTKPYKVEKGDSPYMIAQRHHMNLSQFLRLNNLTPRSMIFPGQMVLVKAD
jgi:membrane-bound lytic murein transglycosylase D